MIKGLETCAHAREHASSGVSTSLSLRDKITALSLEKAQSRSRQNEGNLWWVALWLGKGKQSVAARAG